MASTHFGASHLVAVCFVQDETQTLVEAVGGHTGGTAGEVELVATQTGSFLQEMLHEKATIALATACRRYHDGLHATQSTFRCMGDAEGGTGHDMPRLAEDKKVRVAVLNHGTELRFSTGAARREFVHQCLQVLEVRRGIFVQFGNHLYELITDS